jgi:hypothetical protein
MSSQFGESLKHHPIFTPPDFFTRFIHPNFF